MTKAGYTKERVQKFAKHYAGRLGLAIVPIPAGLKGPRSKGWNEEQNTVRDAATVDNVFRSPMNMGVLHSASGTGTLDVDHQEWSVQALATIGLDLNALQSTGCRIRGRKGEKPFFRLPEGLVLDRKVLAWPDPERRMPNGKPVMVTVLELRGGAVQDVLPPSIHPVSGAEYEWVGIQPKSRADIPEISAELLDLWLNWETKYLPLLVAACPWKAPEAPQKAHQPRRATGVQSTPGERPGDRYKAEVHITEVLERNGYKAQGDRWLPPGASKGSVAGVRILKSDNDGIDRAYSNHGSCVLNNGHSHDSFSALLHLEYDGDIRAATRAAAIHLGIEHKRPEAVRPALTGPQTVEEAQACWTVAQTELLTKGSAFFDAAKGNARQRSSLFELWATLTEFAAQGKIWLKDGHFYISFGGEIGLRAAGVTGSRTDILARLRYLGTLGFHDGVVKLDPNDRSSAVLIAIPGDPQELTFMAHPGGEVLIAVNTEAVRTEKKSEPKVLRNLTSYKERTTKNTGRVTAHFGPAKQTLITLLTAPGATVADLAEIRGKTPATIRRDLRLLVAEGLVKRTGHKLEVTGDWKALSEILRLQRESDVGFRNRIISTLETNIEWYQRRGGFNPRRAKALEISRERLERVRDGEPVSVVLGLAA